MLRRFSATAAIVVLFGSPVGCSGDDDAVPRGGRSAPTTTVAKDATAAAAVAAARQSPEISPLLSGRSWRVRTQPTPDFLGGKGTVVRFEGFRPRAGPWRGDSICGLYGGEAVTGVAAIVAEGRLSALTPLWENAAGRTMNCLDL